MTVSQPVRVQLGLPASADPACVADWDAVSYRPTAPHCLGRLDAGPTYPDDLVGEVHADGRIWSQALWAVRTAIGSEQADRAILLGQFDFDGGTMPALAATSSRRPTIPTEDLSPIRSRQRSRRAGSS